QRQQRPVVAAKRVQKGRRDPPLADNGADTVRLVEQRKQIGFRREAAQCFEHRFSAAAVEEPVMNDRDAHSALLRGNTLPYCESKIESQPELYPSRAAHGQYLPKERTEVRSGAWYSPVRVVEGIEQFRT